MFAEKIRISLGTNCGLIAQARSFDEYCPRLLRLDFRILIPVNLHCREVQRRSVSDTQLFVLDALRL